MNHKDHNEVLCIYYIIYCNHNNILTEMNLYNL